MRQLLHWTLPSTRQASPLAGVPSEQVHLFADAPVAASAATNRAARHEAPRFIWGSGPPRHELEVALADELMAWLSPGTYLPI